MNISTLTTGNVLCNTDMSIANTNVTSIVGVDWIGTISGVIVFIILPSLALFGIVVNIVTLIVLYTYKPKTSTIYIVMGLTVADLLAIVCGYTLMLIYKLDPDLLVRSDVLSYFLPYLNVPVLISRIMSSICVTERIFAVFKPTDFRTIWTPTFGLRLVQISYVSTIVMNLLLMPFFLSKEVSGMLYLLVMLISLVLVAVSTLLVIIKLKMLIRKIFPTCNRLLIKEKRLTKVICKMCVLFLVCNVIVMSMLMIKNFGLTDYNVLTLCAARLAEFSYSCFNCLLFIKSSSEYRLRFTNLLYAFLRRQNVILPMQ